MATVPVGSDIDLTLHLTSDFNLGVGAVVSVEVLRVDTGVELLSSTVMSETSDGVYHFLWVNPPNTAISLIAKYTVDTTIFVFEDINIVFTESGGSQSSRGNEQLSAVINDTLELSGSIEATEDLSAVVDDTLELSGVIEASETIEGVIEETETLSAIVEDSK